MGRSRCACNVLEASSHVARGRTDRLSLLGFAGVRIERFRCLSRRRTLGRTNDRAHRGTASAEVRGDLYRIRPCFNYPRTRTSLPLYRSDTRLSTTPLSFHIREFTSADGNDQAVTIPPCGHRGSCKTRLRPNERPPRQCRSWRSQQVTNLKSGSRTRLVIRPSAPSLSGRNSQ